MNLRVLLFLFGLFISLLNITGQDWVEKSKTLPSLKEKLDGFEYGNSVDVSGDYAVVGAPYADGVGRAYVLQYSGADWRIIATLTASDGFPLSHSAKVNFGGNVSIYGDNIVVGASGNNCAYVFKKPDTGWGDMTETAKLSPSSSTRDFGYSVSIFGDNIAVGAVGDWENGNYSGAAYVFEKPTTGWVNMTETAKLTASDGEWYDFLGYSVGISDDIIVVGAQQDDDNGDNSGSAYVFEKPTAGWANMTETAKLTSSDGAEGDHFGISVCISGNIIVVGAQQDDDNGDNSGSAYVFEKPTIGWVNMTETAKLTASDGASNDRLGKSVDIYNDIIIVGAFESNDKGYDSGSAYVFEKPTTGWINMTESAKLTAADGTLDDNLGYSVSIYGDNIVVGAIGDDDNSGSAYLFKKTDTGWTSMTHSFKTKPVQGLLKIANKYGCSISISGSYAVVGSYGYSNKIGCAYVLYNNGTTWETVATLTSSDGKLDDNFGYSVSICDDVIVVGAYKESYSGTAYVFEKPTTGWVNMTETAKLIPYYKQPYDYFGYSVSISGDNIVVGAYCDDDDGTNSGSAYVFEKPATGWITMNETAKLKASDGAEQDNFGCSVSISGNNIVVGTCFDDDNGINSGSAYVFEKPISGWINMTETAKLTASDAVENDRFGYSVSISGDNIVVGAYCDDDNGSDSGSAYIFEKPTTGWGNINETAKLTASDGEEYHNFGNSVSISGDNIVVGAHQNNDNGYNSGSAYIFKKTTTGWLNMTETAKLTSSDGAEGDNFGRSVSICGGNIVVGASGNDDMGVDSGSAYFFERDNNNIPQIVDATFSVDENSPQGTLVGKVIATDNDGDKLSFKIAAGDDNNAFSIDEDGTITVNSSDELDYETTTSYNLTIQVSDGISLGEGNITVKVNDVIETGMHEVVASDVNVYPNPVKDCLHIKSEEVIAQIKIYNIAGSVVYLNNPSTSYEKIDLSELSSGIYMVYVKTEINTIVKRIIVE